MRKRANFFGLLCFSIASNNSFCKVSILFEIISIFAEDTIPYGFIIFERYEKNRERRLVYNRFRNS